MDTTQPIPRPQCHPGRAEAGGTQHAGVAPKEVPSPGDAGTLLLHEAALAQLSIRELMELGRGGRVCQ